MLKFILFANDKTLYLYMNPFTDHKPLIIFESAQVKTWISTANLSLNVQGGNYIIVSNINQVQSMNNSLSCLFIARTSHHNFLGVLIGDKLKFDKHINKLCSNVSQSIEALRRISHLVPVNILRNKFFTRLYSRIAYAIITWRSSFNSNTRCLESLVLRALCLKTDQQQKRITYK